MKIALLFSLMLGLCGTALLAAGCSPAGSRQVQAVQYRCPMHPAVVSDKPGSCPICGMDLVPVETAPAGQPAAGPAGPEGQPMGMEMAPAVPESGVASGNTSQAWAAAGVPGRAVIQVEPARQQLIGVRVAKAELRPAVKRIRVSGEVAHDPEMYQAQDEYLRTRGYEGGSGLQRAGRIKLEHMGMNAGLIRQLERAGRAKENLILKNQDPGFWVYVYFYEADLPVVKPGQKVALTVPALEHAAYTGTLMALNPYVAEATHSIRGIVDVKDPALRLYPGLFVNAEVQVELSPAVMIPQAAVLDSGERRIVFVRKGAGTFEPREVELGQTAGDEVQVTGGVQAGEQVVVGANFMLDSESQLKAALAGQGSMGGMEGMEGMQMEDKH